MTIKTIMPASATPKSVTRLVEEFSRLPGIGPKTASRLTYHLLRMPEEQARSLAEALVTMKASTRLCSICFNITEADPCPVCADSTRDETMLCVVEEPLDVLAMERIREFNGRYHVLHGVISPVEGVGPEDLKILELIARVAQGKVREVIMATNPSLEGESTAAYLQKQLRSLGVRMTRLARGLPVGGDVEYADETTLARAMAGRSELT